MRYMAVVKADAYGHGMAPIVRRLMQSGVDYFAVANVAEATDIRHMGAGWPILLLSPLLPEEDRLVFEHDLTPTVSTMEECCRLGRMATTHEKQIKIHLKIDTGMGRLGVWHEHATALIEAIAKMDAIQLEGIYTHFSSADTDRVFTDLQRQRFIQVLDYAQKLHGELIVHADNSAGIETLSDKSPFNAVRIGLLQFGVTPYPDSILGRARVEPIFSFHTRIGLLKDLPAGTHISYGRTHTLKRDSRIAILTAGYGDGIPIGLSGRGEVLIDNHRCPILGRVTMDQTIVDVTDCPSVEPGGHVVLIGKAGERAITTTEFSRLAGTIPWETLCSVTKRVPRVYIGARDL